MLNSNIFLPAVCVAKLSKHKISLNIIQRESSLLSPAKAHHRGVELSGFLLITLVVNNDDITELPIL